MKTTLFITTLLVAALGFAAEAPSKKITRVAGSAMELSADLTKDIYRSEAYQDTYEVQIPHQVEETYYVDVPYQEEETYTDYETYYESEYRCSTETDYSNECHNEQSCHNVSDGDVCHYETVCRPGGSHQVCEDVTECGTNAHGEQICKTRQHCRQETTPDDCHSENVCRPGGSHQECSNEQVCHQVPHDRQVCGYEQVAKQRAVERTRTVTHYRQEARTRTVTEYTTEERCCVTRYRDVFDHQASLKASLQFPNGSELVAAEKEMFKVTMTGEKDVDFAILDSIFGYAIKQQTVQNGVALMVLEMKAKYEAAELGKETIKSLSFSQKPNNAGLITFTDSGLRPRVATQYSYQIVEKETAKIVDQGRLASTGVKEVRIEATEPLANDLAYTLNLLVERDGVVLASPITFVLKAQKEKGPLNPSEFSNAQAIAEFAAQHSADDTMLIFADHSPINKDVLTEYEILISKKSGLFGSYKELANMSFKRAKQADAQGLFHLSLKDDFKVEAKDLEKFANSGDKIRVKMTVTRTSKRLNNGQPIVISKEETLKIQ